MAIYRTFIDGEPHLYMNSSPENSTDYSLGEEPTPQYGSVLLWEGLCPHKEKGVVLTQVFFQLEEITDVAFKAITGSKVVTPYSKEVPFKSFKKEDCRFPTYKELQNYLASDTI